MVRARTDPDRASPPAKGDADAGARPEAKTAAANVAPEATGSVEKCINCRFYDRRHAKPLDGKAPLWGQCRRHAPHLNPVTAKAYVVEGIWPLVRDDDWCGEWKILLFEAEGSHPDAPALAADDLTSRDKNARAEVGDD